jgi:hypothetical protein
MSAPKDLAAAISENRAQIKMLAKTRRELEKQNGDPDLMLNVSKASAGLFRSMASLLAEHRKLEAHVKRAVDEMPPEEKAALVFKFAEQLPASTRAELRRLLVDLDGESILSV